MKVSSQGSPQVRGALPRGVRRPVRRPGLTALALALVALGVGTPQAAGAAWFHPALEQSAEELKQINPRAARGAHAYAALRELWSTWDRADPTQVEALLRLTAEDPRLMPSPRAYAKTLAAYARTRRGDFSAARRELRALGFVDRFLVVGPFDNEGKAGLGQVFQPELELAEPIVPGRAYSGKERPVRWREVPDVFPYGWVDLGSLLRPQQRMCGYLTSFVRSRAGKPRTISAWVGVGGSFKLFWNGRQVLADEAYRGYDVERFATQVQLAEGYNQLTLKLCGDQSAPIGSVRLADAAGNPDLDLEFSGSLEHSAQAVTHVARPGAQGVEQVAPKGVFGAVQAFEQSVAGKPSAAALHAYARYLDITGGDDAKEHWARDYARRAAEAEPTVERLLLAGELAEDRNKYASWLTKAEALAKEDDVRVLLARARLLRTSPSWRDAIPYYDRVLAIAPDDLEALQGRVELYNEAGLRQTALATLSRATARLPKSVTLLNMYASQLRALGRGVEADEVERRYAAGRLDDRSYFTQIITLAAARREREAAQHFTSRLLEVDPDSQWARGVSATTAAMLGEPERALVAYRAALTLAPEDAGTLRELADLQGALGQREEQVALLRQILQVRPQDQDVRQYLEHIEPPKARADEAYAWAPARFLKDRLAPAEGEARRTLVDLTVTTVFDNGLSSSFRQVVFQPLTNAAAASSRQYAFQYQADSQRVQLRGARVHRADGSVDEAIESGEAAADNPAIAMYTSARTFYVQFPRLEPGDVVELRYRVDDVTPVNEFADYFGAVEYLQSSEPVGHAEYVLIAPKSRKLNIDVVRLPGLKRQRQERKGQQIHRFQMSKVAKVAAEPSMPPWSEVLGFVHVSTFKDWREMGRWYWGLAKDQFDLDDETRRLVRQISQGKTARLDQVKAVYAWVTENTRYVALEFGIYGYKPRRCVQTVARGWGDCKDKATVIVSMLRELGIDSTIVILRTGMRGRFSSSVASLAPFDHAIAYVPEFDLYLDGTAEYGGVHELPSMDLGGLGLLVNEGDSKLVTLPEVDPRAGQTRQVTAALAGDGSAKLTMSYRTQGVSAPSWRRRYQAEATRRERVQRDIGQEFPGLELSPGKEGILVGNLDDAERPVELTLKGQAPRFARLESGRLSMAVTSNYRLTPSFASLSTRKQDVSLPPIGTMEDTFIVKLPPGKQVLAAPAPRSGSSAFGSYEVKVEVSPGQVQVTSKLQVTKGRVSVADYAAWRRFCVEADSALAQRLVVE